MAMRKRRVLGMAAVVSAATVVLLVANIAGCEGNSAARVEREHGLRLPASVSEVVCRGDAWKHAFTDAGAASAFEMASNDLPRFLAQLKVKKTHVGQFGQDYTEPVYPGNPEYQIHRSWMTGAPIETYQCASPTGDFLSVQVWHIDGSQVGICVYTDWN